MSIDKHVLLATTIAVVAVIVAAGAVLIANNSCHDDHSDTVYRYFVGCGDDDQAEIEQVKAQIENLICNVYHDGYTLYTAQGATYISEGVIAYDGTTLVYEIAYLNSSDASKLLDDIKAIEGVGVVLREGFDAHLTLRVD